MMKGQNNKRIFALCIVFLMWLGTLAGAIWRKAAWAAYVTEHGWPLPVTCEACRLRRTFESGDIIFELVLIFLILVSVCVVFSMVESKKTRIMLDVLTLGVSAKLLLELIFIVNPNGIDHLTGKFVIPVYYSTSCVMLVSAVAAFVVAIKFELRERK